MPKSLLLEMDAAGASIAETGLYLIMLTDPTTGALGTVYRKNEWEKLAESNKDYVDRLMGNLERMGFIVADGYNILIRSYARRYAFKSPKYLRSGLYDLQHTISQPLLRFVIGTELIRLDLADRDPTNAQNMWDTASLLWQEITDGAPLPPIHHMKGLTYPNQQMIDNLLMMPSIDTAIDQLNSRQWSGVTERLRIPLQHAYSRRPGGVTPLRARSVTGTDGWTAP